MDFSHNIFGLGLSPMKPIDLLITKCVQDPGSSISLPHRLGSLICPQVLSSRNMIRKFETHKILLDTTTVMTHTVLSSLMTCPPCHRVRWVDMWKIKGNSGLGGEYIYEYGSA